MSTYIEIASVTVGSGGAAYMEFTAIPNTYTDLILKFSARDSSGGGYNNSLITFNGSSSGYSEREIGYNGSSVYSSNQSASNLQFNRVNGNGSTSNSFSTNELYIPNYTSSIIKSISADNATITNGASLTISMGAEIWSDTSAITSIKIASASGNFQQYSTAYLYGIKKS